MAFMRAARSFEPDADSPAVGRGSLGTIFKRTVKACLQAKIATGEIVHIDASLIRANGSWESLIERHVVEVLDENNIEGEKQDVNKDVCKITFYSATSTTIAMPRL
jgi:hypothetical protein